MKIDWMLLLTSLVLSITLLSFVSSLSAIWFVPALRTILALIVIVPLTVAIYRYIID